MGPCRERARALGSSSIRSIRVDARLLPPKSRNPRLAPVPHSTRSLELRRRKLRAQEAALESLVATSGRLCVKDPGDHRLSREGTIMGPAGLTAVFGMGTGVTPPVWSPEKPAGGRSSHAGRDPPMVGHAANRWVHARHREWHVSENSTAEPFRRSGESTCDRLLCASVAGGEPIGVVKLLGC